jgi:DnaK suppressor protein
LDGLQREATARLAEVDAAVARVAEGRYGICESCGRRIASGRMEARPTATLCVTCASRPVRR